MISFLFQIAEVIMTEAQDIDFSFVIHLVTILSSRPQNDAKGFMRLVCIILLNFSSFAYHCRKRGMREWMKYLGRKRKILKILQTDSGPTICFIRFEL